MEKYVTSLELSKKLKELGVKHKFNYLWIKEVDGWFLYDIYSEKHIGCIFVPAFLSDELLEILPKDINISTIVHECVNNEWIITIFHRWNKKSFISDNSSLPNALAKMLIYLIENKLIKIK